MSFDVLDLTNLSAALGTAVNANRLSPHTTIVGNDIRAYSDDGNATRLTSIGVSVGQRSTFEFDITPVYMPVDFSAPANNLFYVSLQDAQDDIAAIRFSQNGFAFVTDEQDAPQILPSSAPLFVAGTRYTVRIVLDGDINLIDLYITETSLVATDGHQLRYTSGTKASPSGTVDGFTFTFISPAASPQVEATIHTLRVASTTLTPNKRPVAVSTDVSGVTGQAILVEGKDSYDPEGSAVTYSWSFVSVPPTSTVTAASLFPTHSATLPGSQDRSPAFVPDVPGQYEMSLVVNDGSLDSLPLSVIVQATASYLARGYTPSADALLSILSDNWSDVSDKDIILTFWSAIMQIAASDLVTLWQNDRNKSIATAGRRMQRKWLDYDCRVNLSNESFATIRGLTVSGANGAVQYQSGDDMTANGTAFVTSASALFLSHLIGVGTAVHLSVAPYKANVVNVISETVLELDNLVPTATGITYSVGSKTAFKDTTLSVFGIVAPGQIVGIVNGSASYQRKVASVENDYMTFTEELPEAFVNSSWVVGDVTSALGFKLPSDFKIQYGDLSIWSVLDTTTLETEELVTFITGAAVECIGTLASAELDAALNDSNKTVTLVGFYRTSMVPVYQRTESIPYLQSIIKDAPDSDVLKENQHFVIFAEGEDRYILFTTPYTDSNLPPDTLWAEYTYLANSQRLYENFGYELGLDEGDVAFTSLNFDYLSSIRGLLYCYMFGPTIDNLRSGIQIFCGLPFADAKSTVIRVEEDYTTTTGRITLQAFDSGLLKTYFYKKSLGLALAAGTTREIRAGDTIAAYAPLSKGVEVVDFLIDDLWWNKVNLTEPEKYTLFQVGIDINIVDDPTKLLDMLQSVVTFVRKVKPVYTDIIAALQAKFNDLISVTDSFDMEMILSFVEKVCVDSRVGYYGELNSDGSQMWTYGGGLQYGHADRICPGSRLLMSACAPGGVPVSYGSIHRYGSGVQYGGTQVSEICTSIYASTHEYGGEASDESSLSDLTARMISIDFSQSPYTITDRIRAVFVDSSQGPVTVRLPDPTKYPLYRYEIKDKAGKAHVNNITLKRFGSELIDGVASDLVLVTALRAVTLTSNGTNWEIVEKL